MDLGRRVVLLEIDGDVGPPLVVVNAHEDRKLLPGRRPEAEQTRGAATSDGKEMAAFAFGPCAS